MPIPILLGEVLYSLFRFGVPRKMLLSDLAGNCRAQERKIVAKSLSPGWELRLE